MSTTVECFCQSVTLRNSNRFGATQEKLFLFEGYPQICCSKLQLHLQKMYLFFFTGKRFVSEPPAGNQNCFNVPTDGGFLEKPPAEE